MPVYEFFCTKCNHRFESVQSLAEHERGRASCPRCGSAEHVESRLSTFSAHTSSKS